MASIAEFGFVNPILIDQHQGIIAGHGSLLAAQRLGMKKVPAIMLAHLSETQKRALIIADILDPFGGSGSTLIACEKTGRSACLIELDPKYCDVIIRRWQEFTGKEATLEGGDKTFDEISKR